MNDLTPFARAIEEWKFLNVALRSQPETYRQVSPAVTRNSFSVTVLSGFLGAGKTTLLREYMRRHDPSRLGLIVNDFGAVNIDATTLSGLGTEVVPISNGCSCCITAAGLTAGIDRYADSEQIYDHVVIEASGISDPGSIAVAVGLRPGVAEVGIVTLVDAEGFQMFRNSPLGSLLSRQLSAAHLVVLSKSDRLDEITLTALRKEIAEEAAGRMIVSFEEFLSTPERMLQPAHSGARPAPKYEVHDTSDITHLTVKDAHIQDEVELEELFARMPAGLMRIKGNLSLGQKGFHSLDWAGGRWELREHIDASGLGPNVLVLIAIGEQAALIELWAKAFNN